MTDILTIGQQRSAQRTRRWRRSMAVMMIGLAFPLALFIFNRLNKVAPGHLLEALPVWTVIAGLVVVLIPLLVGSWLYYRAADELELADNLWCSFAGFNAYFILFPSWSLLAAKGIAPQRNDWIIFFASAAIAIAVFALRRLRTL